MSLEQLPDFLCSVHEDISRYTVMYSLHSRSFETPFHTQAPCYVAGLLLLISLLSVSSARFFLLAV
jgi:hypothetical protein